MENKKARFNYELLNTYTAGIMLTGPEVKAIRDNRVSFNDAYCIITNGEVIVKKLHISVKEGGENEFLRDRKILLRKKEISELNKALVERGLTIIPISIFVTKTGLIKLGVAVARGKKLYDKRETIKKRDLERNSD
jgi:SsrA-binding protein